MTTCTSCGNDVTGKKFCPECGTPVQQTQSQATGEQANTITCPRCNGVVKAGAAFCMHCGSSLNAQPVAASATPSQPSTRTCIACHSEVPAANAFCNNCGQSMQTPTPSVSSAASSGHCANCGRQNNPGVSFCAGCGQPLGTQQPTYSQSGQYSQQYPSQYGQQHPQQQQQYPQQYGQYNQYSQPAYQPDPMLGQQPMVLRCPICMAMSPVGTSNCPGCRSSLAGVIPTPANMPMQGQQGGFGGLMQGNGGKYAMGALGGAAAVIGGEMLLHEIEGEHRHRHYDDRGDDGSMRGDLGHLANDIGLF